MTSNRGSGKEDSVHETWPFAPDDRPSKIICVGRNWAAHAKEMDAAVPKEPILFLKPSSALIASGGTIRLPRGVGRVDHEVELGVVVGNRLNNMSKEAVMEGIRGWCLALDVTARDHQATAKKQGRPWTVAKGYDTFCPVSALVARDSVDPDDARLVLKVNDEVRQDGSTKDMVWTVAELLSYISSVMTLEPGDLVLTGTPAGVGPLEPGDRVEGRLNDGWLLYLDVQGA